MVQLRELEAELKEASTKRDAAKVRRIEMTIKSVQNKKDRSDAMVEKILEKDETMTERSDRLKAQLQQVQTDIERTRTQLETLKQAMADDPGVATIEVTGTIAAGTSISTPHTTQILSQAYQNVRIGETNAPDETGSRKWRLEITPRG